MTPKEQEAFIDAYDMSVAVVHRERVADFVRSYAAGEDMDYSGDYTSIMDALCIWNLAIRWQKEQSSEALTLSLAELNRHARDTESGEMAVQAIERALT